MPFPTRFTILISETDLEAAYRAMVVANHGGMMIISLDERKQRKDSYQLRGWGRTALQPTVETTQRPSGYTSCF